MERANLAVPGVVWKGIDPNEFQLKITTNNPKGDFVTAAQEYEKEQSVQIILPGAQNASNPSLGNSSTVCEYGNVPGTPFSIFSLNNYSDVQL